MLQHGIRSAGWNPVPDFHHSLRSELGDMPVGYLAVGLAEDVFTLARDRFHDLRKV